jgi:AcrR family transcriptional regulator
MTSTQPNELAGIESPPKDRRVRKSQQALKDAFIALVLESGYEAVTVEDIAERADVARATFYAHFEDKEQLLSVLFHEMITELADRFTLVADAHGAMRTYIMRELYQHAAQFRDLYLVCLRGAGNGKARVAYRDLIATRAEAIFADRFRETGRDTAVPTAVMGRAFAGAHLALLEEWLEVGDLSTLDSMARTEMELLTKGFAWALGMLPDDADGLFPNV